MILFAIGVGVDNQGEAEVSIPSACAATDLFVMYGAALDNANIIY